MFKFMKKLSPVISPMIASLFLFSSTISFVEAATNTSAHIQYLNEQTFIKSYQTNEQGAASLFDQDTDTFFTPQKSILLERVFSKDVSLKSMSVYGLSDYQVSVEYKVNGLWEKATTW